MSLLGIAAAGIADVTDRFERTAARVARTATGLPGDPALQGGDLVPEMVDQIVLQRTLEADVKLARTADQMAGTVLDIIA